MRSEALSSSARSQAMLKYLVGRVLAGDAEINERALACEVFGRRDDYDPTQDSIVRVAAHDLRQRMKRYYLAEGASEPVRISWRPGSYRPVIELEQISVDSRIPASHWRSWRLWMALLAFIAAIMAAIAWSPWKRPVDEVSEFWEPFIRSSEPVILCAGIMPTAEPNSESTGAGAAMTVHRLGELFGAAGKRSSVKLVSQVSYSEFSRMPMVLIGAMNNEWTLSSMAGVPFSFDRPGRLRENGKPGSVWGREVMADGSVVDHALVARILNHPHTYAPVVIAAGLTSFGTAATGEFITSPQLLKSLASHLPGDWRLRNMACILRVRIVAGSVGRPEIVTCRSW